MGMLSWINKLGGNTLYFPGCLTKSLLREEFENYKKIFNMLDIDFILLSDEEVCCGMEAINAGYRKEARRLAKENFELFKKNKVRKIITNCPSCYKMFKEFYPSLVPDWDIDVEHAILEILKGLKRRGINFEGQSNNVETVIYNDCCFGDEFRMYDEPREVINRLGGKIMEMKTNRENSTLCGATGGIITSFPEISKKSAINRLSQSPSNEHKIISVSCLCHYNLKKISEKSTEISKFIVERLSSIPK